ncbi:hypothetical protein LTS18_005619, partial [Coniosporium uncinatum]
MKPSTSIIALSTASGTMAATIPNAPTSRAVASNPHGNTETGPNGPPLPPSPVTQNGGEKNGTTVSRDRSDATYVEVAITAGDKIVDVVNASTTAGNGAKEAGGSEDADA